MASPNSFCPSRGSQRDYGDVKLPASLSENGLELSLSLSVFVSVSLSHSLSLSLSSLAHQCQPIGESSGIWALPPSTSLSLLTCNGWGYSWTDRYTPLGGGFVSAIKSTAKHCQPTNMTVQLYTGILNLLFPRLHYNKTVFCMNIDRLADKCHLSWCRSIEPEAIVLLWYWTVK